MCIIKPLNTLLTVFSTTGSPFAIPVLNGQLATASGPGLQRAVAHKAATFTIDACNVSGSAAPLCVSIISK